MYFYTHSEILHPWNLITGLIVLVIIILVVCCGCLQAVWHYGKDFSKFKIVDSNILTKITTKASVNAATNVSTASPRVSGDPNSQRRLNALTPQSSGRLPERNSESRQRLNTRSRITITVTTTDNGTQLLHEGSASEMKSFIESQNPPSYEDLLPPSYDVAVNL